MVTRVTLPGGQTAAGTVRMVAPTVDAQTRSGRVLVALPLAANGADQRVTQRKVRVGRRVVERVEVAGLAPDAVLVASGAGFLNDGDLVWVAPATANAPTAPVSAFSALKPGLAAATIEKYAIK
jgi:hypothetical protein